MSSENSKIVLEASVFPSHPSSTSQHTSNLHIMPPYAFKDILDLFLISMNFKDILFGVLSLQIKTSPNIHIAEWTFCLSVETILNLLNLSVRLLVCRSVIISKEGKKVTLPCSYRSTCYNSNFVSDVVEVHDAAMVLNYKECFFTLRYQNIVNRICN